MLGKTTRIDLRARARPPSLRGSGSVRGHHVRRNSVGEQRNDLDCLNFFTRDRSSPDPPLVASAAQCLDRSLALGNLRAFVILIVLAFHSVLAYLGSLPAEPFPFDIAPFRWNAFPIVDSQRWFGFDIFCAFQDVYLMSFMFFMSGLFVWPSLRRKGSPVFLYDRFLRIGVPFVLRRVSADADRALSDLSRYRGPTPASAPIGSIGAHCRSGRAARRGSCGSSWSSTSPPPRCFGLRRHGASNSAGCPPCGAADPLRYFAGLVTLSAIAYVPLALAFTPWAWKSFGPFSLQLCRPLHYAVYFFAGVGIGAHGLERGLLSVDGPLARHWTAWWIAASSRRSWCGRCRSG